MSLKPVYIAALEREIAGVTRGWQKKQPASDVFVYVSEEAVVAHAGMGARRVSLAVEAGLEAAGKTAGLVSVGLAGACAAELKVASVMRPALIVNLNTGERFTPESGAEAVENRNIGTLVTAAKVAGVKEKKRLADSYAAWAVDMEAATVARMAELKGLPFWAIKAISDDVEFEMDGLERFQTPTGQFREAAFALNAAMRPGMWPQVMKLGRNSKLAVKALTEAIQDHIRWQRLKQF